MVATNDEFPLKKQPSPKGVSGIEISGGVYEEDYLTKLKGVKWAKEADKMRTQDGQVQMVLAAVQNPIRAATWEFVAADAKDSNKVIHRDFAEFILTCDMMRSWEVFINEVLGFIAFGHSVFEIIHKNVSNHPKWGSYTGIKSLSWRSPKTLEEWILDPKTGELKGILQRAQGDFNNDTVIPAEFLLVFTVDLEGNYFASTSNAWLRSIYGNYLMKQFLKKLKAIGHEKMTIGTPKGVVPAGTLEEHERKFEATLQRYTSNENSYIMLPAGYEVEILKGHFDASGIEMAIEAENQEMVRAFLANFLNLGQGVNSGGGAFALGADLSDFFLKGIQYIADLICSTINNRLIPHIIDINFGEQDDYPKLICSGVQDVGKEQSEMIKNYIDSGAVVVDQTFRTFLRKLHKLPPEDKIDASPNSPQAGVNVPSDDGTTGDSSISGSPASSGGQSPNPSDNERDVVSDTQTTHDLLHPTKFQMSGRTVITKGAQGLEEVMALNLDFIANKLVVDIVNRWKNLPATSKRKATQRVQSGGKNRYKKDLRGSLSNLAAIAQNEAEQEVGILITKFSDPLDLNEASATFPKLPKSSRDKIQVIIDTLTDAQLADLEKEAKFAANSAIETLNDPDAIANEIKKATDKKIKQLLGAAPISTASELVNSVRLETFLSDESRKAGTVAFEFFNPNPVSQICQNLAGRIFSVDNAAARANFPPLHFNCKSILRHIKVGSPKSSKVDDALGLQIVAGSPDEFNKISSSKQFTDSQIIQRLADVRLTLTFQTLIFDRKIFSRAQASQWCANRGFANVDIEETDKFIAIRQRHADEFISGTIIKIQITQGVFAMAGDLIVDIEDDMVEPFTPMLSEDDQRIKLFAQTVNNLQSLVFDKRDFTRKRAVEFARNHKFKFDEVDEEGASIKLKQQDKSLFVDGTLNAINITRGLDVVVGRLKNDN